jgi:hypothetical protein
MRLQAMPKARNLPWSRPEAASQPDNAHLGEASYSRSLDERKFGAMKVLRSLVNVSAVVLLVLWPVSALAANAVGNSGTVCDQFASVLGAKGLTGSDSSFVFTPSANGTVTNGSTSTFCLPAATKDGDLVAVLDFTPANPFTTDAFSHGNSANDAFGIDVRDASTGAIVTHWTPDQCHPGHNIFTLSALQMNNTGPFLLDFNNFSGSDIGFTMTMMGPGASGVPGATTTPVPFTSCP